MPPKRSTRLSKKKTPYTRGAATPRQQQSISDLEVETVTQCEPCPTKDHQQSSSTGTACAAHFDLTTVNLESVDQCIVPSTAFKLGFNVDAPTRAKIVAGEFVNLSMLLKQSLDPNDTQGNTFQINSSGDLVLKPKQGPKITNMEQWLDAFLPFSSIYLAVHSNKAQQIIKYISDIRLFASKGGNFIKYDEQFRLRLALDKSLDWDKIDSELWLQYSMQSKQGTQLGGNNQQGHNLCYTYNFQGACFKQGCPYAHLCLKANCHKQHPLTQCPMNQSNFRGQQFPGPQSPAFRQQGPNAYQQSPRPNFRPRGPRPNTY